MARSINIGNNFVELIWLNHLMHGLHINLTKPMQLHFDNQDAMNIASISNASFMRGQNPNEQSL